VLEEAAPAVRIINLETSVTRSADFVFGKAVHYRMNPDNLPCVSVARPDVCAVANNHVLDFGQPGLAETLGCLAGAGLPAAGAGLDQTRARHPVAVPLPGGRGRALVFSCGTACSGIPPDWAATASRPGVDLLPSLSLRPPMPLSPGPRPPGSPTTSSSYPSTGAPTGDTRCPATRFASPAG